MSSEVFEGSEDSSERLEGSFIAGSVILNWVPEGSGFHLWSLQMGQWRADGNGEWVWHLRSRTEWVRTLGVNPCVSESLSSLLSQPLVQTERAQLEAGRFVYRLLRSPMCEYLVNFLHKLRQLPERYMMNSVLENFTILQVMRWFPA